MAVRKILLCWLRELVAVRAVFKTLRGDRACKALSLGEVAAAVARRSSLQRFLLLRYRGSDGIAAYQR